MENKRHFSISTNNRIESMLKKEMERTGKTRNKIVHEALYKHIGGE